MSVRAADDGGQPPASPTTPAGSRRPGRIRPVGAGLAAVVPAALLLFALLAFRWYGRAGAEGPIAPRIPREGPVTGWSALPGLHVLAVAALVLAVLLLGARLRADGSPAARVLGGVLATVSLLVSAVLVVQVLVDLPGGGVLADAKLGAVIGLGASLATVLAGLGAALPPPR